MNRKGFTLIEVIIAVAALSILSVYMVQLFIHANNLNTKAYETDQAVVITQNILELVEQQDTPLAEGKGLYKLNWKHSGEDYRVTLYFDEHFEGVLLKKDARYELDIAAKMLKKGSRHDLYELSFAMNRDSALPMEERAGTAVYKMSATKLLKDWE